MAGAAKTTSQISYQRTAQGIVRYERDENGKLTGRYPIAEKQPEKKPARASIKHKSANIVKWGDFKFSVTPNDIVGVKDISLSGSCDTEEKESGKEKYAKYKSAKPMEFSVKVILNAYLTSDVKGRTLELVKASMNGKSKYLYMGNEKLFTSRFMLTAAKVGKVTLAAGNTWVSAEIDLTFKQSTKYDGTKPSSGGGGGGGGGKKKSGKKSVRPGGRKKPPPGALPKVKEALEKARRKSDAAKAQSRRQQIRGKVSGAVGKVRVGGGSGGGGRM